MRDARRPDVIMAFEELAQMLSAERPLPAKLVRVTELVKETLPGVEGASITVETAEEGPWTVAFTGQVAIDLDERQYEAGSGPCLDAARTAQTVAVDHDDPLRPYREFSELAAAAGVNHTLSVGLPLDGRLVGGINIYVSGEIDESFRQQAEAMAGYAAATAYADLLAGPGDPSA